MKKKCVIFFALLSVVFHAQEFKIISLKDSIPQKKNYDIFEFINNKTPIENLKFLATVSCSGEKSAFSNIFEIAKFNSQNIGANSFKFLKKEESENSITVFLDIYYSEAEDLIRNRSNEEENKIYIFWK